MIDFAKYAFNKSHAAAYAVVSYQTAYLKYYYPVEFMAALMTSVIDFPTKVAEYFLVCRQMGIKILPPDINCGMYGFSVDNGAIRYGLSAIKSVGRPVIESLVSERQQNGLYRSLKDFMERNTQQMNKRAVENFIKAGALDCLEGNRRQKMMVYQQIADNISQERKNSLVGQMSKDQHSCAPLKYDIDHIEHNISGTRIVPLIYHIKCEHENKEPERIGFYDISQYKSAPLHPHRSVQRECLIQKQINRYDQNQHHHVLLETPCSNCRCSHRTYETDHPCKKVRNHQYNCINKHMETTEILFIVL